MKKDNMHAYMAMINFKTFGIILINSSPTVATWEVFNIL